MNTEFSVIIPARYQSQRLPAKILADIAGKTMIQRVYEQASQSAAKSVIVATDDERIFEAVKSFGGKVVMTRADHPSGTDRLQEVAAQLGLSNDDIVVNVQGDEPLIPPAVIDQVAQNLAADKIASAATLCMPITETEEFLNPNAVKVVFGAQQHALYFSRAPIAWPRDSFSHAQKQLQRGDSAYRHIGIYAYRVAVLNQYVSWQQAPLEQQEKLEQLRILYNGAQIHVAEACATVPAGVDTENDLERIREFFAK